MTCSTRKSVQLQDWSCVPLDNCLNYTNVTCKRIPDCYTAMEGVSPSSGWTWVEQQPTFAGGWFYFLKRRYLIILTVWKREIYECMSVSINFLRKHEFNWSAYRDYRASTRPRAQRSALIQVEELSVSLLSSGKPCGASPKSIIGQNTK